MKPTDFEIQDDASEVYFDLQPAYRETLVAPRDDMWATFADMAGHYALRVRGDTAGCCAINEERELLFFYVDTRFQDMAEALFDQVIERLGLVAAVPSTVDPGFLSLSLSVGRDTRTRALMYQHVLEPQGTALSDNRLAGVADHPAATAFVEAATGMPRDFLDPYLADRIAKGELFLHEENGEILASGECRLDQRELGYAHLGIIVSGSRRGQGLGSRLMHELVLESGRRNLKPLCSTEPENVAARRAIERAGFRARHRVLCLTLDKRAHAPEEGATSRDDT